MSHERGENGAVGPGHPGPRDLAAQYRCFVAQGEDPGVACGGRTAQQDEAAQQPAENQVEQS
jgi:hypothetical protein